MASYRISNDGSLSSLEAQAEELLGKIKPDS
jgi:hypothetical protein